MSLPETIQMQTIRGDREIEVRVLSAVAIPTTNPDLYKPTREASHWDGHCAATAKDHLTTWTLPSEIQKVSDRAAAALEDGIPDQKRTMLRNQEDGQFEDRYIADIAMGYEVENPFQRWSKRKRDTISVTICMDATSAWWYDPDVMKSRMAIAAGLTRALEDNDYDVKVVVGNLCSATSDKQPRRAKAPRVNAVLVKDEDEVFIESNFAHFADTGFKRLVSCWTQGGNTFSSHMTDREWRELAGEDNDLIVYIGAGGHNGFKAPLIRSRGRRGRIRKDPSAPINTYDKPNSAPVGPVGDDTLRLEVNGYLDIERAVKGIEQFFGELCGN